MSESIADVGRTEYRPHGREQLHVLLVDDDRLVRTGIAGILATAADIRQPAEANNGVEALDYARAYSLDVALLDIQMPKLDGIRTLRQLRIERPSLPIAMLTTFSDENYIAEAISLGALGFFLKSDDPQNLITGVRALATGGAAFSPRVGRWLVRRESVDQLARITRARDLARTLSKRQRDLLAEIGLGSSNAEIARSLGLSEGTVKQYLTSLFTALGLDNRVNAAIFAYEAGLIDLD